MQAAPPPLNGRRHAPRLHSDGLFPGRTRATGLPRGACCAWLSGSGSRGQTRVCGTTWLLRSSRAGGPRPERGGRGRLDGGPGAGACGASAELAGRAGARAAAPPPGAGKAGCAALRCRGPRFVGRGSNLACQCVAGSLECHTTSPSLLSVRRPCMTPVVREDNRATSPRERRLPRRREARPWRPHAFWKEPPYSHPGGPKFSPDAWLRVPMALTLPDQVLLVKTS